MNSKHFPNTDLRRSPRRVMAMSALAVVAAGLITASCAGSTVHVVHNYRTLQNALDSRATCKELFQQRDRVHDESMLARFDRDLARIGCASPESTRNDG